MSWSSSLPSFYPGTGLSSCALIENSSRNTVNMHDRELHVEGSSEAPEADFIVHKLCDARSGADQRNQDGQIFRDRLITDAYIQPDTGVSQTVNQV